MFNYWLPSIHSSFCIFEFLWILKRLGKKTIEIIVHLFDYQRQAYLRSMFHITFIHSRLPLFECGLNFCDQHEEKSCWRGYQCLTLIETHRDVYRECVCVCVSECHTSFSFAVSLSLIRSHSLSVVSLNLTPKLYLLLLISFVM